jgi:probable rRNA maturation factor
MGDDPPYLVSVANLYPARRVRSSLLKKAAVFTFDRHKADVGQVVIAIVDDRRMAELNHRHLNHEGTTDVITFDMQDEEKSEVEGDIVISWDTADREARRRGHSVSSELALYVVHGALHLLGYDDCTPADSRRMHREEDEILGSLGLGAIYQARKTKRSASRQEDRGASHSMRPPTLGSRKRSS